MQLGATPKTTRVPTKPPPKGAVYRGNSPPGKSVTLTPQKKPAIVTPPIRAVNAPSTIKTVQTSNGVVTEWVDDKKAPIKTAAVVKAGPNLPMLALAAGLAFMLLRGRRGRRR